MPIIVKYVDSRGKTIMVSAPSGQGLMTLPRKLHAKHDYRRIFQSVGRYCSRSSERADEITVEDKTFNIKVREPLSEEEDVHADLIPAESSKNKAHSNHNKYWRVPFFPCASFTGRDALLQRILDYFTVHNTEIQRRFAIYGLGGVGT